jgi:hypothetical protein
MIIFNTKIATCSYKDLDYYRTKSFKVKAGEKAHVVLHTSPTHNAAASFDIMRAPASDEGVLTEYSIPATGPDGTKLRLGSGDNYKVISIPGTYFLAAGKKADNAVLADCDKPTFVEVFIEGTCCET